jgi:hypothetical protein
VGGGTVSAAAITYRKKTMLPLAGWLAGWLAGRLGVAPPPAGRDCCCLPYGQAPCASSSAASPLQFTHLRCGPVR